MLLKCGREGDSGVLLTYGTTIHVAAVGVHRNLCVFLVRGAFSKANIYESVLVMSLRQARHLIWMSYADGESGRRFCGGEMARVKCMEPRLGVFGATLEVL